MHRAEPPAWQVWLALGTVYVIWGSTYLAIRVVVESLPPLGSAGVRFTFAGLVLGAIVALRRGPAALRVTRAQLRGAGIVGLFLLLLGNGSVQLGERDVPSALAALIVASTALWIVLYRRIAGERVEGTVLAGVLIGFLGVAVLALPRGITGEVAPVGLLFILVASAAWGWGTFMSKRLEMPRDALTSTTLQQLIGGLALLAAAVLTGERIDPAAWTSRSLVALTYLVVFGSLVAFSAYTWLLVHVPMSKVSTYVYVNPVVAVLLGALILAEPITPSIVFGAILVITAVAFIVRTQAPPAPDEAIDMGDAPPTVRSPS
ncbi:MAG: EamA family transporter [Chloroflexi bacterium]|nr:EamA family transporter [Chloroflexota bacterium]